MTTRLMIALFTAALAIAPAMAQDAPPETQLQAPGQTSQAASSAIPSQPEAKTNARPAGDPCPAPAAAAADTPDDLAKVQEDIDRYTLCVQRAQLLERLNESVLKNQTADDVALGYKPAMPGMAGPQRSGASAIAAGGLPPLPDNALAGADVTPVAGQPAGAAVPEEKTASITPQAAPASKEEETPKAWTISEIYGTGTSVQAKLVSPEGDEVRAQNGDRLSDGTVVVRITPAGVSVRGSKGVKSLDWTKS